MYFKDLQLLLERLDVVWLQTAVTACTLSSSALISNTIDE